MDEGDRRRRVIAVDGKGRVVFAALAVVVPLVLFVSFRRQEASYPRARIEADADSRIRTLAPAGLFVLFGGLALLSHRNVRRAQSGAALGTRPRMSPEAAGRLLAVLLLFATLAPGFDPKVRAVMAALLGPRPLGMPAVALASLATAALFAPFFWVMPHLMRIVMDSHLRGGSLSKVGIALAVARVPPALGRSRAIVLGGFAYFAILVGAFIALTSSRGI